MEEKKGSQEVPGFELDAPTRGEMSGPVGRGEEDRLPYNDKVLLPPPHRSAPTPPSGTGQPDASDAPAPTEAQPDLPDELPRVPSLGNGPRRRALVKKPPEATRTVLTPEQRLLILDTWKRSGLPAGDFAAICGVSKHTLYSWKWKFESDGPAGLMEKPRGAPKGSRMSELTKRTVLMIKEAHPDYGCERISLMLLRGPGLSASPSAVAKVLHEAGYELHESPTRPHGQEVQRFERARPNQLWQTDLFTFVLKRQNRRLHLVAFMDDHSRFIVGFGLYASPSTALVIETLRAAIVSHGAPEEVLTDNGPQYVTWRGRSAFSRELEKRGVKQLVAKPRRPQTLGKIERFWGTLWSECVERAIFRDLEDARRRVGLFIDHYNLQRPHQGIEGMVPADRFFGVASEVSRALKARAAANALQLARDGVPRKPFYLTGQIGGNAFSVHAEGDRLFLTRDGAAREEVDLSAESASADVPTELVHQVKSQYQIWQAGSGEESAEGALPLPLVAQGIVSPEAGQFEEGSEEPPMPGESPLDEGLENLWTSLDDTGGDV